MRKRIDRLSNLLVEALIGEFSDLYPDMEGEHIKGAAVLLPNGDIAVGDHHDMAYSRLPQTYDNQRFNQNHPEGFVTNTGRFLSRKAAMDMMKAQRKAPLKQYRPSADELDSANFSVRESHDYIDWDSNYGKTFKVVRTPEGAQTGEYSPGLISVVTPENGSAWTSWPEVDPNTLRKWKSNWDEIQRGLGQHKYDQIKRSQQRL